MIDLKIFNQNEPKLLHLATLWNHAEADANLYDRIFQSNPHELATMIANGTTYNDWQLFLVDARVQDYIDRVLYTQAGILANKLMNQSHLSMSDGTRLNTAVKYRDDHKPSFATPVQYIYIHTPLTIAEAEFLPDVPENDPHKVKL